jgi:uncharacterized protein YbjT (DUF2867 family)
MPVYAVTGASGHLGRFAIEQLLARGVPPSEVVAVVRDRGKAASLAGRGVTVREAHYSRPETLGAALAGVNRHFAHPVLMIIWNCSLIRGSYGLAGFPDDHEQSRCR